MKLLEKKNQHRRDFTCVLECESCGWNQERLGYDDRNFHDNVIPEFKCPECDESTNSLGLQPEKTATRYAAHEVV